MTATCTAAPSIHCCHLLPYAVSNSARTSLVIATCCCSNSMSGHQGFASACTQPSCMIQLSSHHQADIEALRGRAGQHTAVQALPNGYISSNDIVFAIAWLLGCNMLQRPWPGQGPPGSANVGLLAVELTWRSCAAFESDRSFAGGEAAMDKEG